MLMMLDHIPTRAHRGYIRQQTGGSGINFVMRDIHHVVPKMCQFIQKGELQDIPIGAQTREVSHGLKHDRTIQRRTIHGIGPQQSTLLSSAQNAID